MGAAAQEDSGYGVGGGVAFLRERGTEGPIHKLSEQWFAPLRGHQEPLEDMSKPRWLCPQPLEFLTQ